MARVPDVELERLKAEVSVERLAEAKGVELRRHGANLLGLCPFHDDREPSLVITPSKNLWHCLGACQKGGSPIDWVMASSGVSFRHAVELLRADSLVPSFAAGPVPPVRPPTATLQEPFERSAGDQDVLRQVVTLYARTLQESPEAMAYLDQRGLGNTEMVAHFQLGFANRTLGYRLPSKDSVAGKEMRSRLQTLGVLRATGHEHFNGSLVIPVVASDGVVTEMYGRKVTRSLRAGTPDHLYLPGKHRGVWNEAALQASKEIILCESLIDALTFWCAGLRNVTASYGTEGFTEDHLAAFARHGTTRLLIAYDRDAAGDRAATELAKVLTVTGIEVFRILFPKGMDANEYARDAGQAPRLLSKAVRTAVWLGAGSMPSSTVDAPVATPSVAPIEDQREAAKGEVAADIPSLAASAAPAQITASPMPEAPPAPVAAEVTDREVTVTLGDRRWRVRGLSKNSSYDILKVNVLVGKGDEFHVDTLDLYAHRQRVAFVATAAATLRVTEDVIRTDIGKLLLQLEGLVDLQIRATLEPADTVAAMSAEDRDAALELLRSPDLLQRILTDFDTCGVVGEETNKLAAYLAATSRKLDRPLAVVIQSSSAAGKSSLLDAVLAFLPDEERVKYSAMTGQSLFYMGETNLAHKALAIVEEGGVEKAAYALKLLQSEGELSIASTGKDPQTGRLTTHEYRVTGPVAILLTTTAIDVDEELLNRCLVLTVDEDRAQTRAIHTRQRRSETLDGLLAARERERILGIHQAAQRLLRPLFVANPFAEQLTFADEQTRMRRDHTKYLTLIRTVALLHQYQREQQQIVSGGETVTYIEVTPDDIAVANRIAHDVLGRSLDELPPQTRRLLLCIDGMVQAACTRDGVDRSAVSFTRRDVRAHTGWGDTQLKVHLGRLCDLEYVLVQRGLRGFAYELAWDGAGRDGRPFFNGLLDPDTLGTTSHRSGSSADWSGQNLERSGSGRPPVGVVSAPGRTTATGHNPSGSNDIAASVPFEPRIALLGTAGNGRRTQAV